MHERRVTVYGREIKLCSEHNEEHILKQEILVRHPLKNVHRQRCTSEGDREF